EPTAGLGAPGCPRPPRSAASLLLGVGAGDQAQAGAAGPGQLRVPAFGDDPLALALAAAAACPARRTHGAAALARPGPLLLGRLGHAVLPVPCRRLQGSRCHDRATVRSHSRIRRAWRTLPHVGGGSIFPMGPSDLLYRLYERRLAADLRRHGGLPRHVGVILDGNRRWARELGMDSTEGHRRGAAQIDHLLAWSAEVGIPVVTLWLLSTENLLERDPAELAELFQIIEAKVEQLARDGAPGGYRIVPVGPLHALPQRAPGTPV